MITKKNLDGPCHSCDKLRKRIKKLEEALQEWISYMDICPSDDNVEESLRQIDIADKKTKEVMKK